MRTSGFALLVVLTAATSATPTPTSTTTLQTRLAARETSSPVPTQEVPANINTISQKFVTIAGVTNDHVTIAEKTITLDIPTCEPTIKPDKNGYVPPGTCGALWGYYPRIAPAATFAIMFALLTAVHIWQAARYKKGFCWVIIMASIWETVAFTFRALSARDQQSVGLIYVYQIFILLAPIWINAFDYMILGRMIHYFVPSGKLLGIPSAVIGTTFVLLDITSFIVQLVGGSTSGPNSPPKERMRAIHIYMGGIGLQQFFIVLFVLLAAKFHLTMSSHKTAVAAGRTGWKPLLYVLYLSLAMITVRIIFRFIEFSRDGDPDSPLLTQEGYFYALEAAPMFIALLSFAVVHPGRILVGPAADMPGIIATVKALFGKKKPGWTELSDGDELLHVRRK